MSGTPPKAVITGIGAVSAVGLTAPATAAAIRAAIARFGEFEDIFDDMGEPVVGAAVPLPIAETEERLAVLVQSAALEALTSAGYDSATSKPPVVLISVFPDGGRADTTAEDRKRRESQLAAVLGDFASVRAKETIASGHAGFVLAIAKAIELFDRNFCSTVVIAAADSLIVPTVLDWLQDNGKLKTSYQPKGIVPGEAAAVVIVERTARPGVPAWACCHGVGKGMEPVGRDSEQPALAAGLTEAMQAALDLAGLEPKQIEVVLCDLNGEPYRFNEWAMARNRVLGRAGDIDVWHPVASLGDVGAASGGILTVLAGVGLSRNYWKCGRVLLWSTADSGERAALCLSRSPGGK